MKYYLYKDITTEIETDDGIYLRKERIYLVEYYLSQSKPIVTTNFKRREIGTFRSEDEARDIASAIGFEYKHTPPGFFSA